MFVTRSWPSSIAFKRRRSGKLVVMFRRLRSITASLWVMCVAMTALAASKDDATLKKIDEALKDYYPAAQYDKAETVLRNAIKACGEKACSRNVLARAYVAQGIVRGKASSELAGARKAFESAKKADPNVTLDESLVSRAVLAEFYKVMGRELPPDAAKTKARGTPAGNMRCTPASGHEIQTARPIAVVCDPLEGMSRAELHYRFESEPEYTVVLMSVQDGTLRINIPCEPLVKTGTLDVFVVGQDFNEEKIDTFGNAASPVHYKIVNSTKDPVPSYPGEDPPKRCKELLTGVASEGQACSSVQPCKHGLYCAEAICQKAPTCETDSDCKSDRCSNGYCSMDQDASREEAAEFELNRWMIGLHGGLDFWVAPSAKSVCGEASLRAGDFFCYNEGQSTTVRTANVANTNVLPMTDASHAGNVDAGVRAATVRVLASVDRVLSKYVSAGVRLGWAFGGGPRALHFNSAGVPSRKGRFIPVHAELRGTLWLRSLTKPGLHPALHLSAGMADVDASIPIRVKSPSANGGAYRSLDAWHRLGPAFVGGGPGLLWTFSKTFGLQLDVNAMLMLPSKTGLVVEPTMGAVVGF
jgi:hypothetical protein